MHASHKETWNDITQRLLYEEQTIDNTTTETCMGYVLHTISYHCKVAIKVCCSEWQNYPLLSLKHRQSRLEFVKGHINWSADVWKKVFWSDGSKCNIFSSDGRTYIRRKVGEELTDECVIGTVKHGGVNVMVWAVCVVMKSAFWSGWQKGWTAQAT